MWQSGTENDGNGHALRRYTSSFFVSKRVYFGVEQSQRTRASEAGTYLTVHNSCVRRVRR